MKKKLLSIILAAVMVMSVLTGCGQDTGSSDSAETSPGGKVGVSMPAQELQRWNQDGSNIQAELEAAGYEVDLQFASNDSATQSAQIEDMINSGCELLVIAAVDGNSLGTTLELAREKDIPVIAYDRLLMGSGAVSYYATFDNPAVGKMQGEFIRDQLDLDNAAGSFTIEVFTGDPGDNNSRFFYNGAMNVLRPYIDEGKLIVKSGQTGFDAAATAGWSTEAAQTRMDAIVSANYADGTNLDAVLCASDVLSLGVENSLENGYMGDWPVITGQDCDIINIKNMIDSKQSMNIFKDTRTLASKTVDMVDAIMRGNEVPVNDMETYDNGKGVVPTYVCEPVFVDVNNYREVLIDSGYYTESELN